MGIGNVLNIGQSGMTVAKQGIATAGHNIANANTPGYTRQKVHQTAGTAISGPGAANQNGQGAYVDTIARVNDEYLDKSLRKASQQQKHFEEKDLVFKQIEDSFNELNGEGLNRLMTRFFNTFRQLSNDPNSEAVRQAVRESSQAVVNDFKRINSQIRSIQKHIDARIEGQVGELNATAEKIRDVNLQIARSQDKRNPPNDLINRREVLMKQLAEYADVNIFKNEEGSYSIDIRGVGPLVTGPLVQKLSVERGTADEQGKPENSLDIRSEGATAGLVTHSISGGRLGALLEVRDKTLSSIQKRMDNLAFNLSSAVNRIHRLGFTRDGNTGVDYFKPLEIEDRASEFIELSDPVKSHTNNIAAAGAIDSPGDNRIANALGGLQDLKLWNNGKTTADDFYNSIISDVAVAKGRNEESAKQQEDIVKQLTKMRDQVSGVSIDEETSYIMQYSQAFDASAKVIQTANDMMNTVLSLKS